jgi:hypothetical protein
LPCKLALGPRLACCKHQHEQEAGQEQHIERGDEPQRRFSDTVGKSRDVFHASLLAIKCGESVNRKRKSSGKTVSLSTWWSLR